MKLERLGVYFSIEHSDRSQTLYVIFSMKTTYGYLYNLKQLRISDHYLKNIDNGRFSQFIIEPTKIMSKKKSELFERTVKNVVNDSIKRFVKKQIEHVSKKGESDE